MHAVMQAVSSHSLVPSRPFTTYGGSISSGLVGKQTKLCTVQCFCAHGIAGEKVPQELTPYMNSARGVRQFGFWERTRDCTTTTPDSLQ
jgi:hypothetical protein